MAVRKLTKNDDLGIVAQMIVDFQKEHTSNFPYDLSHFVNYIEKTIDDPDNVTFLLNENQGMLVAALLPTEFAPEKVGREILWYVKPECRGKGFSLFRAYENWARENGAHYVFCGLKEHTPVMDRLGFTQVDVSYFKCIVPEAERSAMVPHFAQTDAMPAGVSH